MLVLKLSDNYINIITHLYLNQGFGSVKLHKHIYGLVVQHSIVKLYSKFRNTIIRGAIDKFPTLTYLNITFYSQVDRNTNDLVHTLILPLPESGTLTNSHNFVS